MKATTSMAAAVVASLGLAMSAGAATSNTSATTELHHHAPMGMRDGFMVALHQLNLTSEQQQSIKSIMSNAHQEAKSAAGALDYSALNNPGDPNYAQAVREAQNAATQRIEQRSNIDQQIYNLLTPEQKTQLPKVLTEMKAKAEQRRDEWQQKHNQSATTNSGGN